MSAVLSAANAALQLSTTALHHLGEPALQGLKKASGMCDRWPMMTAGVVCLITTVNAVALGIIGNIALGVVLGIAALGAGALTLYLWSFSTLKDLEGYVEAFAERVTVLAKTALHLSASNEKLEETRLNLERDLLKRTKLIEAQKKEIREAIQNLDHVYDDLQQSQLQVVEMGKILDASHDVITELSHRIGQFVQLNQQAATTSQALEGELKVIQSIGERFDSSLRELGKQNQLLLSKKQQADEMTRGLYAQFLQIAELFVGLKRQAEELAASLHSLQRVDIGLATSTANLHQVAEHLERGADEAQTFLEWMKQFEGLGEYAKEQMSASYDSSKKSV